jgi:RNA polymerase sigma-70 factor (ECF subfamily)
MPSARQAKFEALVGDVGEQLRRYARRRVDHHTADDVVADAFAVIWRRLDEVPAGHELAWCYAVTRLCLSNAQRAHRRQASLIRRLASVESRSETAPWEDAADADSDLRQALRSLRPADRELLWLWAWEDLAPQEIAVLLGVSANAASIRLHRARQRLADQLGRVTGKGAVRAGHKPIDEGRSA